MSIKVFILLFIMTFVLFEGLLWLILDWRKIWKFIQCKMGHHDWQGCRCSRCGAQRDEGHAFRIADPTSRRAVCITCGAVCEHKAIRNCHCTRCGMAFHKFRTTDEWWDDKRNMYKWRGICTVCGKEDYR